MTGHRRTPEAPWVRERVARLYGWGSLLSCLLLFGIAGTGLLELVAPRGDEVYPVLGALGMLAIVAMGIAVLFLALWVLVTDRGTPRSRRWLWGAAILMFNFPVAAAFFLTWWWKWDAPLPLFRKPS